MKHNFYKIIGCLVFVLMTTPFFAQDIIVTNDSKKVEAKILEVSSTEIKYKEHDNLDGPIFILNTSEISSIIYKNGKVVLYNQQEHNSSNEGQKTATDAPTQSKNSQSENTATIFLLSGQIITGELIEMNSQYVACMDNGTQKTIPTSQIKSVALSNGQVKEYESISDTHSEKTPVLSYISRSGNTYYYEGEKMRGASYERFLEKNCEGAYYLYYQGEVIASAGWTLFACGLGLDIGCSIGALILMGNKVPISPAITALSIIGLGCEIACIPTLCVGYSKKHKSADVFNGMCAKKTPQAYWSINASQNGFGIAYNF